MNTNKPTLLEATDVFDHITSDLERRGIAYALLHPGPGNSLNISSDIDLALDRPPPVAIEPILLRLAQEGRLQLVQRLHYDVPHGYYYVVRVPTQDGFTYLQLDCLHDEHGINRYHLSSQHLLKDRQPFGPYYRLTADKEAEYLVIKRALKRNMNATNTDELAALINAGSSQLPALLGQWLGKHRAAVLIDHCKTGRLDETQKLIMSSGVIVENRFIRQNPMRALARHAWTAARNARRFLRPTGLFVVLLGPDGCGKSTVSEGLRSHMGRAFRDTWRFHWRPKLLPKLGRSSSRERAEGPAPPPAPPTGKSKYRGLSSLARFAYYWLDFVIGYWLVVYPRKARSTLIVGERYFPDVLVHPERYGFSVPRWLMRLAAMAVPSPDLLIFLTGDPQQIHDRKPELPVDMIDRQLRNYAREITYWRAHYSLDTCQPLDTVFAQLEQTIAEHMQERTAPGTRPDPIKYAFPRFGRARVLVDKNIRAGTLRQLYDPQSTSAKLLTRITDAAPRLTLPLLARRVRGPHYGNFPFPEAERIIREQCGGVNPSICYYLGNAGPRSKITAQSYTADGPIYIKIADSEAAKNLLHNEHAVLSAAPHAAGSAPRTLALIDKGRWLYLFVSGPTPGFGKTGLTLTDAHERYVAEISLDTLQESPFTQFALATMFEERVSRVAASHASGHIFEQSLQLLRTHFDSLPVKTYRNHGDFAPWNLLSNNSGSMFAYDWEYSEPTAPAFSDLFHFLRSTRHFVFGTPPARCAAEILDPHAPHAQILAVHAARVGAAAADLPFYLLLYLLREILRHTEREPSQSLQHDQLQARQAAYLGECLNAINESIRLGRRPLRVLVSAYACEADKGSEPGVGWNWAELIASNNLAWVITRSNNRASIERALSETPNSNLRFIYVDLPPWARFWKRKQRGVRTYYYLWQLWALAAAYRLNRKELFDLSHHVTFVNDWLWSFPALLSIPFIWGPIGSHPPAPFNLLPHPRARVTEFIRIMIQRAMRTFDPLYWLTATRARKIIAINKEICRQFPLNIVSRGKCVIEPAIAYETLQSEDEGMRSGAFVALYVGRFHYTKCPHLAIHAFARLSRNAPDAKLVMIGRGPEERHLRNLAQELGCSQQVVFIPWLTQSEVFSEMRKADVFLFPSTEGGGMVVIEAMANGLPVICLDYGGPGQMVCEQCGSRSPIASLTETVESLYHAMSRFHADRQYLAAASDAARHHARETLSWKEKLVKLDALYAETVPRD